EPGAGMNLVKLLFGFGGRTGRAMLWLAALIWTFVITVIVVAGTMIVSVEAGLRAGLWVVALGFVSAIAVGIKRLHDRNKTPLWLLLFYGAPITLLYLSSMLTEGSDPATQPMSVTVLGYAWLATSL